MKTALLASLALTLATPGAFAVSQAEGGPLQAIDIFSLEMANDPQISPDGRWVAYQRRSNDIMTDQTRSAIWTAPYEGGANRPLVTGTGDYSAPRWSPDSSQIVFVANEDGGIL